MGQRSIFWLAIAGFSLLPPRPIATWADDPPVERAAPADSDATRDSKPAGGPPPEVEHPAGDPALIESQPGTALPPPLPNAPVDFWNEVEPILRKHCVECHGPAAQNAALRLDKAEEAAIGGISRKPIRGGTRETNELYRRVSSDDPTYRMPKQAPSLSPEEIERIGRWVDEGSPWPERPVKPPQAAPGSWADRFLLSFYTRWLDKGLRYTNHIREFTPWLAAALVLVLLAERTKVYGRTRTPRSRLGRWWIGLCSHMRASYYLLAVMAFALYAVWDDRQSELDLARVDLKATALRLAELEGRNGPVDVIKQAYGDPPLPIRPTIPKRLGGEFYRGNCERNEALFNGGNYRTATMRLALCNSYHEQLQVGDPLPTDGLSIRYEIIRAPHTTDSLYTDEYMNGVFLTSSYVGSADLSPLNNTVASLEIVEPMQRWVAYFPLDPAAAKDNELSGVVYVYWGLVHEQKARGTIHYAISYDLKFADGRIAEGSDLWMGSIFWSAVLATPQRGKIPLDEWFDYRPIPEIDGENSTDPTLLGLPEHERKLEENRRLKADLDAQP